ncbi:hypothetical protein UFOVP615_24 [uncultured Caudovirales phage]|uniref:Transglycosylase SLT domain-containing protein n=1 Tax=uncultured Caudovirales phage TaxID=2100421 RepID=A0A6J5N0J8_9CAUD|nr:hypothetical protein UFOVP615_24 [uncultured Caudovirales phage]
MKNLIIFFFCIFGFFLCSSFDYEIQEKNVKKEVKPKKKAKKQIKSNFDIFADSLAFGESSNVADKMNLRTGCVGLFQFCSNRAADFKLDTKTIRKMNRIEQKLLFKKHVRLIKKNLGKENYLLLKKKGFSDGSIIAIAHLGGVSGLKKYAKLGDYNKDYNPSDGYTKLSDYDAKYSKYDNFLNEI